MHKIVTLAAAASLLTLAACNREAETAPATDPSMAEATSADTAGTDASASTSSVSSSSGASSGAMSAGPGSETMDPTSSSTAGPTGAAIAPVTQETRDNAKMAAEETNLHPKPPAN